MLLLCVALGRPVLLGSVAFPLGVGRPELPVAMIVFTIVEGATEVVEFPAAELSGFDVVEGVSAVDLEEGRVAE